MLRQIYFSRADIKEPGVARFARARRTRWRSRTQTNVQRVVSSVVYTPISPARHRRDTFFFEADDVPREQLARRRRDALAHIYYPYTHKL